MSPIKTKEARILVLEEGNTEYSWGIREKHWRKNLNKVLLVTLGQCFIKCTHNVPSYEILCVSHVSDLETNNFGPDLDLSKACTTMKLCTHISRQCQIRVQKSNEEVESKEDKEIASAAVEYEEVELPSEEDEEEWQGEGGGMEVKQHTDNAGWDAGDQRLHRLESNCGDNTADDGTSKAQDTSKVQDSKPQTEGKEWLGSSQLKQQVEELMDIDTPSILGPSHY